MTKKIIIMLMTLTVAARLTACGTVIQNPDAEPEQEIHVATIPAPAEDAEQPTRYSPVSEAVETAPTETVEDGLIIITEETTEPEQHYNTLKFDEAVFAAILDTIDSPVTYFANDLDGDSVAEFLISAPLEEGRSRNIVLEGIPTSGLYYYDATGVDNDFYVINPENGRALLNENTHDEEGNSVSTEYFVWTGNSWELVSQLYGYNCYWNYEPTTQETFLNNAGQMQSVGTPEDIFNIYLNGTPEQNAKDFYDYLSEYFQISAPLTADIDSDGTPEQVLFIQNLTKRWGSNVISIYGQESVFDTEKLNNVHTTCFVLDTANDGRTRLRSENFDRKYTFQVSGTMLFAYDDTNSMQTIQYSRENDGRGIHFMSMMWG